MRVPIDWLKDLVNFRAGADQLAEMLSLGGLETRLLEDEVLEVDILPNRADAWSIRGIAREVSALTKFKMKPVKYKVNESGDKSSVKVEVRDRDLCPRYMARMVQNVKVGESPEWLKKRLERAGIRSINNVVDVTNYLLLEIGQPMHAFDAALIKDQTINVRRANPEEKMITLDGKEHVLNPEILVIADPEKVIACAGVMGGANTEVSAATKNIILESAYFNPISIHMTSKALRTRSESSIRFEHGVDWDGVEEALDRGAALIAELGRGDVMRGKIDIKSKTPKTKIIELRLPRIKQILGKEIPAGDVTSILKRLGFEVKEIDNRKLKIGVPLFRAMDVEREIDLIEEVARIYGYSRIETTMPATAFAGKDLDRHDAMRDQVREIMIGCGLNEVQSYSMIGPADFEKAGISAEKAVKISNPLTIDESIMRTHILPGLLKAAVHNQNRQIDNVFIFEIGRTFLSSKSKMPEEKWALGVLASGSPFMSALDKGEADFLYLKGIIETLLGGLGIKLSAVKESDHFLLQPGKGAKIEGLGIFGALHPDIRRNFELNKPVYFIELDLDALYQLISKDKKYRPLPKFPAVTRDISMFVPSDLENQQIIDLIKQTGGQMVEDVFPFDKFKDSVAYRVIYRNPDQTLTEEEVNRKHQEIISSLTSKLAVRIRM